MFEVVRTQTVWLNRESLYKPGPGFHASVLLASNLRPSNLFHSIFVTMSLCLSTTNTDDRGRDKGIVFNSKPDWTVKRDPNFLVLYGQIVKISLRLMR